MNIVLKDKTLDKELLINLLQENLNWSESHLTSFSMTSLNELYQNMLKGYTIAKAKTNAEGYYIYFTLPKAVYEELGIEYGDYFGINVNIHEKEIILHKQGMSWLKVRSKRRVALPSTFADKRLLKGNDDMLVMVKDGRIVLKSFSYMQ